MLSHRREMIWFRKDVKTSTVFWGRKKMCLRVWSLKRVFFAIGVELVRVVPLSARNAKRLFSSSGVTAVVSIKKCTIPIIQLKTSSNTASEPDAKQNSQKVSETFLNAMTHSHWCQCFAHLKKKNILCIFRFLLDSASKSLNGKKKIFRIAEVFFWNDLAKLLNKRAKKIRFLYNNQKHL